ncbi:response regulator transcription factor [Pseudoalteromonas prydzensis]|uniref:response regulator transcription factor n=1 Tax=Pseudoalteromonas prydzensis TaxID=182141 RepID=UPI0007E52483|nr:response regulator transcription factor [Pseudoalteromonas prydzensis]MBE0379389.1 hypothetical protein [Pseudoalteromonas prydzensis ACAM 620]
MDINKLSQHNQGNLSFYNDGSFSPLFIVSKEYNVLMVKYASLSTLSSQEQIANFMQLSDCVSLAIFDVPKEEFPKSLKDWPNLKGIFYQDTNLAVINQGLQAINQGELWFPRAITDNWMREYLANEELSNAKSVNLTTKELKVLNHLNNGLSSVQIADKLFISEGTVRVHLHKIYTKLAVKNKQQAIKWCQHNSDKISSVMG